MSNAKYYVIHSTNIENLIHILKTKILYANKYIDDKYKRLSGIEDSQYVYTSVYTKKGLKENFGISLIFDAKILHTESFIFNYGWLALPNDNSIYVNKTEDNQTKDNKIKTILKHVNKSKKITDYEILFIAMISLDDYLVGISCPDCDSNIINKIKKILDNGRLKNIKIYTDSNLL